MRPLRFCVVLSFCFALAVPAFANTVVINGASAVGSKLTITGTGFSGTLTVTFNGTKLKVVSNTATQIVVTISPLPAPGTYRFVVTVGTSSATSYVALSNIVARVSLTGQVGLIPATTLLTPTANALYRVSVYMVQQLPQNPSCSNNCGSVVANFQWTDDGGTHLMPSVYYPSTGLQLVNPCPYPSGGGPCTPALEDGATPGLTFLVRANAGNPLIYSVTGSIDTGVSYDFFLTVEQLM